MDDSNSLAWLKRNEKVKKLFRNDCSFIIEDISIEKTLNTTLDLLLDDN
jgi:hypothetical protein